MWGGGVPWTRPPPPPPRRHANPPPPKTKVTMVGNNVVCNGVTLVVGPFLVHKLLGPRPRVFLKGGGGVGGAVGGTPPTPTPAGDPEFLEAPKKFFGLN